MTLPDQCQLIIDPPCSGVWNMAVDEALLEWSAATRGCCWRFYRWEEPTLSLGYFQKYDDRAEHADSRDCPTVRRLTGGGAIVHDAELTYSLILPAEHPLAVERDRLYAVVHESLIEAAAELDVSAGLCGPPDDDQTGDDQAGDDQTDDDQAGDDRFLCFQRRTPGDVLIASTKIAGSAQRRRRGAVLQHGSVLLQRSAAAGELAGLEDVTGHGRLGDELADAWLAKLSGHIARTWHRTPLWEQPRRLAEELARSKYASDAWTRHRRCPAARPVGESF
ncbi:MAG: lipoate--protein ligase family protein [Candidatus Nealsonbacteria bacterium]|nr:lipoate--protein ligase family protein [Candidatus Nealsonbacteria bacterium]